MRSIITWTIALVAVATLGFAAVPQTINYQGYLKDSAGAPVSSTTSIRFSLYSSNPARNNPVWRETKNITPTNGIYSTQLGSTTPIGALFDVPYLLGVKVAGDAEMPLQSLASVPYSLRSGVAESSAALSGQSLSQLDSRYINPADPARLTTQQIALQNWETRNVATGWSFLLGVAPSALVFDGSFVWAAFAGDGVATGTVRKLSPATGYVSGAAITVGVNPSALVFDGTYIWVANRGSDNVTRITAATGAVSGTFSTSGNGPAALTWDGTYVWVANASSNNVVRINPATGTVAGSPVLAGTTPVALAYDGTAVWAVNYGSNNVTRILAASGARDTEYPVGSAPVAVAYYPTYGYLWVVNNGSNTITQINKSTYATTTYNVPASPNAILVDGLEWWLASGTGVSKYGYPSTLQGTFNNGHVPTALTFDGTNLWAAYKSYGSITRLDNVGIAVGVASVGSVQLQENAVTTSKLAASSVTANKLNLDGDLHLNDHTLYLRTSSDDNHGLGWFGLGNLFAGANLDGPVLYGFGGGALGTTNGGQNIALAWNSSGNIGIGTAAPADQLEITGNLRLPATTASAGRIKSGANTLVHTFGSYNFFAGVNAGTSTTAGSYNAATGTEALYSNTTGSSNSASGAVALYSNTLGIGNTASGAAALYSNTIGGNNCAYGASSLESNTTAGRNTAIGTGALQLQSYDNGSLSWNSNNTAVGYNALFKNQPISPSTGINNTAVGYQAGYPNITLYGNTTGSNNTFIGANSGPGTTSQLTNATAIGYNATVNQSNSLVLGGTGSEAVTVGIGTKTPAATLSIVNSTAATKGLIVQGAASQSANLQEWQNSAGTVLASVSSAGVLNLPTNGLAVGSNQLVVSGGHVGIGKSAGSDLLDLGGTLRMNDSQIYLRGGSDTLHGVGWYVSDGFVSGSKDGPVVYGCGGGTLGSTCGGNRTALTWDNASNVTLSGTLGVASIPTGTTSNYLCSSGTNSGTLQRCGSSLRLKEKIVDLPFGLDAIRQLRPVSFTWKANGTEDFGFIAEEVAAIQPVLAIYNEQSEPDGVKYANMSAVLVKAMQEQQALIEAQGSMIRDLRAELEALKQALSGK